MYGLGVPPHEAVGISLLTVGATAWVGAIDRIRAREADLRSGLVVAVCGAVATPLGAWVNTRIAERTLLGAFGLLMLLLGVQLFRTTSPTGRARSGPPPRTRKLQLAAIGIGVGVLSGLFGIGGGFLVVPSLILVGGLPIHTAAATSLVVIALVSTSGVASFVLAHGSLDLRLSLLFVAGSIAGLAAGSRTARRFSGPHLRRTFAAIVVIVGVFVLASAVFGQLRPWP